MKQPNPNPIIWALDTTDLDWAKNLANKLSDVIGGVKLGLELISAHGPKVVQEFSEGPLPIFLDLKFHDIPNTVAKAVLATASLGASLMTVHASGGRKMLEAAKDSAMKAENPPKILAVTVPTSLVEDDLKETGIYSSIDDQVLTLATLAKNSGCDGVICSPNEITILRNEFGNDFLLVVPGIRPAGTTINDQKRIQTPLKAIQAGADRLVIGRPITQANDPHSLAKSILKELSTS